MLLMAQVAGRLLSQPHVPRVNERRNEPSVTAPVLAKLIELPASLTGRAADWGVAPP